MSTKDDEYDYLFKGKSFISHLRIFISFTCVRLTYNDKSAMSEVKLFCPLQETSQSIPIVLINFSFLTKSIHFGKV